MVFNDAKGYADSIAIPIQLLEAIRKRNCILYAGAGFSLEATLPNGDKLPTGNQLGYHLAVKLRADGFFPRKPKESETFDLQEVAERFESRFGRNGLIELLREIYYAEGLEPGEAHFLAIKLFPIIVTTNYDPLFELAAILSHRPWPVVIRQDEQIPFIQPGSRQIIIKLHGDLEDLRKLVITNEDYRRNPISYLLRQKLTSYLLEKMVLFMGYSLSDSDFQEVYFKEVLDQIGNLKPRSFAVTPFPSEASPDRNYWDLFREKWEQKGIVFLDATAGIFLKQLDVAGESRP